MINSMFLAFLGVLFFAAFVTNGTIPFLPVTPFLLWLTHYNQSDVAHALIVLVATMGNVFGWMITEKTVIKRLHKRYDSESLIEKALQGFPQFMHPFFHDHIVFSILVFNALPFPADPFRVVASFKKMPRRKVLLFITIGRLCRYSLLVVAGRLLMQYKIVFWCIFALFLLMPLPMLLRWVSKRVAGNDSDSEMV